MNCLVLYSSLTGNTKKIAYAIYDEINTSKDIFESNYSINFDNYDTILVGYWVDKGLCDPNSKLILENLTNKNVILFGTLGAKDSGTYYDKIKLKVESLLDNSNNLLGHFLCQGKINPKLTERYKELLKTNPSDEHAKAQIENHKNASTHPDDIDILNAKNFIKSLL